MRYLIRITDRFNASHRLRLPGGGLEPLHGHTWNVEVVIASDRLDDLETVMDFHDLQAQLTRVLAPFQSRHLNDIEPFISRWNPTAERVAEWIFKSIDVKAPLHVERVSVEEAAGCFAIVER